MNVFLLDAGLSVLNGQSHLKISVAVFLTVRANKQLLNQQLYISDVLYDMVKVAIIHTYYVIYT